MLFRRRAASQALRSFAPVADAVDRAQRALLAAVPTYRNPGMPLREAMDAFARALGDVDALMPSWESGLARGEWERCAGALAETREALAALRASPPGAEEFEALNARIGDVLAPLETFAETERRFHGKPV